MHIDEKGHMTLAARHCPFCGLENLLQTCDEDCLCIVYCRDCHSSGPPSKFPEIAVLLWNRRRRVSRHHPLPVEMGNAQRLP